MRAATKAKGALAAAPSYLTIKKKKKTTRGRVLPAWVAVALARGRYAHTPGLSLLLLVLLLPLLLLLLLLPLLLPLLLLLLLLLLLPLRRYYHH